LNAKLINKEYSTKQFRKKIVSGSKSHRLLLFCKVKVFGHFVDERSGFGVGEVEDGERVAPKIE
jgi:hypothetical protein